jgi:hypothetical protein
MRTASFRTRFWTAAACVAIMCVASACPSQKKPQDADAAASRALVIHYIQLVLANAPVDSTIGTLYGCEADPSSDAIVPIAGFDVLSETRHGDTIVVPVVYHVLGSASHDLPKPGGAKMRFEARVMAESVAFEIVRDTLGRQVIDCGYYPPSYRLADEFNRWRDRLTPSSIAAWDSVYKPNRPK